MLTFGRSIFPNFVFETNMRVHSFVVFSCFEYTSDKATGWFVSSVWLQQAELIVVGWFCCELHLTFTPSNDRHSPKFRGCGNFDCFLFIMNQMG